jgi:hypothetical protein
MEKVDADVRRQMLVRATSELLAELLDAVGDLQAVMEGGARLAAHVLRAEQALLFDDHKRRVAVGLSSAQGLSRREHSLAPLLKQRGVYRYALPEFRCPAEDGAPVVGMAGVIPVNRAVFVLGLERSYAPFTSDEQALLAPTLAQLARPLHCTLELLELKKVQAPMKLSVQQLPLKRLDAIPQLEQLEVLLIQEAMRRAGNNKTQAAAWLGITREGLRKKIRRLGIALGADWRPNGQAAGLMGPPAPLASSS